MGAVDASQRFDHPLRRRSQDIASSSAMKEGCTSGVLLENELILMDLPKVSEVATNH